MKNKMLCSLTCCLFVLSTAGLLRADVPPTAAPVFSPAAGTYTSAPTVTITSATSGAYIRYTTDGSTPTETNGTFYSGPVSISHTTMLKAIAYVTGFTADSPVTSGLYAIITSPAVCLNVLYDFTRFNNGGWGPPDGLVQGSDGNFYGTTYSALGGLVQGSDGNFYGTTFSGGSSYNGTVFKMTPDGALTTLVSFDGTNGAYPVGGLVQGSDGNFYGTSIFGGSANDGTVFKMTPAGALTTLVSFDGTNGANPRGLVQGSNGNFYGTTTAGGIHDSGPGDPNGNNLTFGTIFMISPTGVLTTLVLFNGTSDGYGPKAPLVQGSDGNFYGSTGSGGSARLGTIFKMTPAGALTSLASFNGANGADPVGRLVQGSDGNFYGTTFSGGSTNNGTVFKMTPAGALTSLVSFDGANGAQASSPLVQGSDGNFYGTTPGGGIFNSGVIFQLIISPQVGSPAFSPAGGTYASAQSVTITSAGASTIYYTTDGTAPTTASTLYTAPISIANNTVLQAIGVNNGGVSPVASATYTILPQVAAPVFSPDGGEDRRVQRVTILTVTNGASIRYTLDGSVPTESNGTLYVRPVVIIHPATLKAIAYEIGFADSTVTSGIYGFDRPPPGHTVGDHE